MYREIIAMLKEKGVVFESGLSDGEILAVESRYKIQFPKSMKDFLKEALPVSKGFYNWRNSAPDNIASIKSMINYPFDTVYKYAEDAYWNDNLNYDLCIKMVSGSLK